jgi:hypothetical protein
MGNQYFSPIKTLLEIPNNGELVLAKTWFPCFKQKVSMRNIGWSIFKNGTSFGTYSPASFGWE